MNKSTNWLQFIVLISSGSRDLEIGAWQQNPVEETWSLKEWRVFRASIYFRYSNSSKYFELSLCLRELLLEYQSYGALCSEMASTVARCAALHSTRRVYVRSAGIARRSSRHTLWIGWSGSDFRSPTFFILLRTSDRMQWNLSSWSVFHSECCLNGRYWLYL